MEKEAKILLIGNGEYRMYENAFFEAFRELGYVNTELFAWNKYLKEYKWGFLSKLSAKAQNKYHIGPRITKINNDIIKKCKEYKPQLIFIYSGIVVYPKTIETIKKMTNAMIFSYNNDDPFAAFYSKKHWKYYKESISKCDYNFVYRTKNVKDIWEQYGINAEVLKAYYIDKLNYPCKENELISDVPDVIFLGHYENDERCEYIQSLVDNGIRVGVPEEHYKLFKEHITDIVPLADNHKLYNQYLCSCKIPLIFLSKINNDTYTRRCFEIPAARAFIFSPYTQDMSNMFSENKEAVYYRDKKEFVDKIVYYLSHDEERVAIAERGYLRLKTDGYEAKDRVQRIIEKYDEMTRG